MFDTYRVQQGPSSVDVRVTEKRAPTDESVRLLKEMEDEARAKVIESVRVQNCGIEAVIHRYDDPLACETKFAIIYTLNGERRAVRHTEDALNTSIEKTIDALWKALADDIAGRLLKNAWRKP